MQFIPGSNKWDVLEHRSPGGDKHLHPLECCGDFARDLAVAEPLAPGGCTVHDARTLHYTGANTSDAPRLAYILIYNTPPVYKPGRREFPWLEGRWTDSQTRKKEWHRRGGLAVDLVRRLPAIRLTSPRWLAWATIRAVNKVWPLTRSGAPASPAPRMRRPHARRLAESVKQRRRASPAGTAYWAAPPGRRALLHCRPPAGGPILPRKPRTPCDRALPDVPPLPAPCRARMRRFRRASRTLQTQP